MLNAKKLGHSIYSFVRKQSLFSKIAKLRSDDSNISSQTEQDRFFAKLSKTITSKNMFQFSRFFETLNLSEKYYILKNKSKIEGMLQQKKWDKGLKLFEAVIKQLEIKSN